MKLQSIRWQLPFSYAAIAFIATLCLSAVLLTVLKSHYANLESRILAARAQNVSHFLGRVMPKIQDAGQFTLVPIANQMQGFAFLTDTRITVYDESGDQLLDTGSPGRSFLTIPWEIETAPSPGPAFTISPSSQLFSVEQAPQNPVYESWQSVDEQNPPFLVDTTTPLDGEIISVGEVPQVPGGQIFFTAASPFGGFDFAPPENLDLAVIPRSDQFVEVDIRDPNHALLGTLSLREGRAFGHDIIDSVARGALLSGIVAVFLAATAGLLVSARMTEPIIEMTEATTRMSNGDLSVRTALQRNDELGVLSSAFNTMAARIEDTVTTLRRFVADAAHEFNTPLTALRTNLELALETHEAKTVERALLQLTRLETLAQDLLDLSRVEALPDDKASQPVNLVSLVHDTSIGYASRAEQADIEFDLNLPDETLIIYGNPGQIRRLICNLLDNAIKFTPHGGIVRVRLDHADGQAKLCVEDTGIGIPKDDLPQLFSRFHRARNANTYPGSGLGLAIVKAIVDAHHGKVYVESSASGTRIVTMLPGMTHKERISAA